jgi:hypothetical protein
MVSNTEFDKFFDDLKDRLKQLIDHTVDEKLEPIRALLLKEVTPEPQIGDLVDALEIAELMGFDISTPEKQKIARQKVYYLARTDAIPSVRISQRRVKFDMDKVKQRIASGGVPQSLPDERRTDATSTLQH